MVYNYLLGLYKILESRSEEIKAAQAMVASNSEQGEHLEGRLAAITDFNQFLHRTYHTKLPRRLQKTK